MIRVPCSELPQGALRLTQSFNARKTSMTMNSDHHGEGSMLECRAVQEYVRSRVVRLVDLTAPDHGGSAIKLRVADRHFLATAAHVVPRSHEIRALIPGVADGTVTPQPDWALDESCDVAVLELTDDDAEKLRGNFVTTDELLIQFDHSVQPAIVVGYPGQFIHSADQQILADAVARVHDFRSITVFTETLPESEWPADLDRAPRHDTDVFAHFDPDPHLQMVKLHDAKPEDVEVDDVHLGGVSGGGIWIEYQATSDSGIWRPDARLIGIDVSFKPRDKWLRGTLIKRCLDLVQRRYPDLHETIRAVGN